VIAMTTPGQGEWVALVGILLLLVLAGFMAAAEVALTRMSLVRALALEEEGRRGAGPIVEMLRDPARHLNTILLLTLVAINAAAVASAAVAQHVFGDFALTIATVVVTVLLFVFSEVIPKTYTLQNTERVAFVTLPVIRPLTRVVQPLSRVLIGFANVVLPGKGIRGGPFVSEAEIRQLIEIAGDEESIEDEERQMIHSVFEFNDTVVREVMVPRPDMVTADADAPLSGVLDLVVEHGYSRIPVYRGDIDHIEGIVYAKDLLARLQREDSHPTAAELARPAEFVPETKRISELLREMQMRKFHMAVVFDEYGAVAGLVTLEDLIEEIVGEIVDEYDVEEPQVERIDEETLRANGRLTIHDANELLVVSLPDDEWDTVGGLMVGLLGRVPEAEESVDHEGLRFTAERVEGHRILTLRIKKLHEGEQEPQAAAGVG